MELSLQETDLHTDHLITHILEVRRSFSYLNNYESPDESLLRMGEMRSF